MTNTKYLLLFTLLFAGVLHVYGDTLTCQIVHTQNTQPPAGVNTLHLYYPTDIPTPNIVYYQSTSGNVEVNVSWCSGDSSLTSQYRELFANTTNEADNVMVLIGSNTDHSGHSTSTATRLTGTFALLLSALFGSLFVFPKSRLNGVLVFLIVCIAICSAADSQSTVTILIGVPPQITSVCENSGKCHPPSMSQQPTSSPNNITDLKPTQAPTVLPGSSTGNPTNGPTSTPAALHFNLRVLILSGAVPAGYKVVLGADWAQAAFASVGMPYDYVIVDTTTDLSQYLSTSGTGKYSGIVTVYDLQGQNPLIAPQMLQIINYQKQFGVKWVIVGRQDITALDGVTAGDLITGQYFDVTFAPEFAQYGKYLNQSISVNTKTTINWSAWQNTQCMLYPVTITDPSTVTPVLIAHATDGTSAVAAAAFKMPDGTQQLHYYLQQGADYIHSMAFASVMVNWISPANIFVGSRRLTLLVQPDDLFLGSYVWNTTTHSNPVTNTSTWYRISADDLQLLADNLDTINKALPKGSYVTVEWPTNFGGINNLYYTRGEEDYLHDKALEIIDKFYYLSHTWDHPCTIDNMDETTGYNTMHSEVADNIAYAPQFFGDKMHLWSNFSMITPCVQGLYNGGVLRAMSELGVTACVSDESVSAGTIDYEPVTPYHGVYTDTNTNGFAGVYLVPREALDIDYSARTPEDVVDEYNHRDTTTTPLDFESLMMIQRMYALEDKIAFRHDPYMLHQTNAATFLYEDPTPDARFGFGSTYNTSLVGLFVQRIVGDMLLYYSLPIVTVQMDNVVNMFQQRQTMDACGLTATLGVTDGKVVDVSVTSSAACTVSLSGLSLSGDNVDVEIVGPETTSFIDLDSATSQSFSLSSSLSL
eukprot:Phypoly_transcript_02202.p1 GENE.Phypoly_transcript_02202~~Phypoly_transcript_02202.p1  ORF type:complete len:872 (+),score=170.46 Phypoly_transcript_02202:200-2815(+)